MSDRLWVGSRKGLFELRKGRIAKHHFAGQPVTAFVPDNENLFCALNLGHFGAKLWRSRDDGASWQEVACPAYPKEEGGATLNQVWVLEKGEGLWAGTIPGGLFHSSDDGDSWRLIDSLWKRKEREEWFGGGADAPGIHSILIRGKELTIAVSCGGVWHSRDNGERWELIGAGMRAPYMPPEQEKNPNIQDVHRMVRCAAKPEVIWVQHHGGIYRSMDGGKTFDGIGDAFGFAVVAHPKDADTAWFVPALKDELRYPADGRLVVTRTRDGGKTFERLTEGLPQEHAYDLVYRHGLDIDASGRELALGSTTGGLWISANGGDAWRCIGAHLPPIYCVRFSQSA